MKSTQNPQPFRYLTPTDRPCPETYRNLNWLHAEVADGWEGLGSCCQVVCRCGSHCPHADQHGGGDTPDVLADIIQIWQLQLLQEVLAQHDTASEVKGEGALWKVNPFVCVGGVVNLWVCVKWTLCPEVRLRVCLCVTGRSVWRDAGQKGT